MARKFGAVGIGLCRTEHMFFEGARIKAMREMIIADSVERRKVALNKLLPLQRGDFEGMFKAMDGYDVTIRGASERRRGCYLSFRYICSRF